MSENFSFTSYVLKTHGNSENDETLAKKVKNINYYHPVPIWTEVALNVETKIWLKTKIFGIPKGLGRVRNKTFL